jgi:hypothetical protein
MLPCDAGDDGDGDGIDDDDDGDNYNRGSYCDD